MAPHDQDFRRLNITQAFPCGRFSPEGGEALLHRMALSTIIQIGSTDEDFLEGGGLLIDYVPAGETQTRRVVFAFNELGLWVEWEWPISSMGTVPE
jgi:hypothetical protein